MSFTIEIPRISGLRADAEIQTVGSLHPATRHGYTIFHPYGGLRVSQNGIPDSFLIDYSLQLGGQQRADRIPIKIPEGTHGVLYFCGFEPAEISVKPEGSTQVLDDLNGEFLRPGPICYEGAEPIADSIYQRRIRLISGASQFTLLAASRQQVRQRHPHEVWLEGLGAFGSPANVLPTIA